MILAQYNMPDHIDVPDTHFPYRLPWYDKYHATAGNRRSMRHEIRLPQEYASSNVASIR
jgi:hypothetical protein